MSETHRFKIGDFLVDESFPWICGKVKQLIYAGGRNKWAYYLVINPKSGKEEVISDSQVKRVFIPHEDAFIRIDYDGDYIKATAPIELILKLRPEVLEGV